MFENEKCWILTGKKYGIFWKAKILEGVETEGSPTRVYFDANDVIEMEENKSNIVGFMHTHPNFSAHPSSIDDSTMAAWVNCFGKPLLCAIKGIDGLKFWLYFDDEKESVEVPYFKIKNYYIGIYGNIKKRKYGDVLKYTTILQKYGVSSHQAINYKNLFFYDKKFLHRASKLDDLFLKKSNLGV